DAAYADRLEAFKKDRRARRRSPGGHHGSTKIAERERQGGSDQHRRSRHAAALCAARQPRAARPALRLRAGAMRRLHGPRRRQGGALMRDAAIVAHRPAEGGDARGPRHAATAAPGAARLHRGTSGAMRLLHQRHDHGVRRVPLQDQETDRGASEGRARQQSVPLWHPCPHRQGGHARGRCVGEAAMTIHASRRDVLKGGGALVVSFSLAGALGEALGQGAKPLALTEVDSFLAIDAGGVVTVYSGKVDLGTGVATALPQMVADELDVPLNRIKLVQGDTALTPDQGTTWGSLSIQIGGMQLRNAAATAKAALLEQAAKRLGAKPDELKVVDGVVSAGNKRVSYGELIEGRSFVLKLDHAKPAAAKDPKDYKLVGKPVPRVDIPDKVTGRFTYMQDFRVPGMLHGRVVRPSAIGATLESVDDASIRDVAGVVKVVRQGNFLGVVAESEWGAIKAAEKLKASWSKSQTLPDAAKLWDEVRASKVAKDEVTSNVGNTADAMGQAGAKTLKATYDFA